MKRQATRCTLSQDELAVRGRRWGELVDRAAVEAVPIPAGLRLRFADAPSGVEQEVRELAALETECCAFAEWAVTTAGDSVCLDITAEGDAVAAVQAMFASFR
jgi:hypothetical protein